MTFAKARKSIGGKGSKGEKKARKSDVYADGGFQLLQIRDHGYLCLLDRDGLRGERGRREGMCDLDLKGKQRHFFVDLYLYMI